MENQKKQKCVEAVPIPVNVEAFSAIKFEENNKKAKFLRIFNNNLEKLKSEEYAKYIKQQITTQWKLSHPNLIISVTGGARNFTVPIKLEDAFKKGLYKAASSTGAWIITGGSNCGVMRLVGDAIGDEVIDENVVCIGIATYNKLERRAEIERHLEGGPDLMSVLDYHYLTSVGNPKATQLDINHTHFIFVDTGLDKYGQEIDFRTQLEIELRTKTVGIEKFEPVPIILVVVNGGPGTYKTVLNALNNDISVLLLAESRGCADVIADIIDFIKKGKEVENEIDLLLKKYHGEEYSKDCTKTIQSILTKHSENPTLLNVFKLGLNKKEQDFDGSILKAFYNLKLKNGKKSSGNVDYDSTVLNLALHWNRVDIATNELFNSACSIKESVKNRLFKCALEDNKYNFVKLLLDSKICLKKFLTKKIFYDLYTKDIQNTTYTDPFQRLIKKFGLRRRLENLNDVIKEQKDPNYKDFFQFLEDMIVKLSFLSLTPHFLSLNQTEPSKEQSSDISSNGSKFNLSHENANNESSKHRNSSIKDSSSTNSKPQQANDSKEKSEEHIAESSDPDFEYPEVSLFIWAVMRDRIEIANMLWKYTTHPVANALIAFKILKSMSSKLADSSERLLIDAEEFETLAINTANDFFSQTHDKMNSLLVLSIIPHYDECLLAIAHKCGSQRFMAQPGVQEIFNQLWYHKLISESSSLSLVNRVFFSKIKMFLSITSFGLLAPCLFSDNSKIGNELKGFEKDMVKEIDPDNSLLYNHIQSIYEYLKEQGITDGEKFRVLRKLPGIYEKEGLIKKENDVETGASHSKKRRMGWSFKDKVKNYFTDFLDYWNTPFIHYVHYSLFYTIFLTLFMRFILYDLNYFEQDSLYNKGNVKTGWLEVLLLIWIIGLLVDELDQFYSYNLIPKYESSRKKKVNFKHLKKTLQKMLHRYFEEDIWNLFDVVGIVLFIIAITYKWVITFHGLNDNPKYTSLTKIMFLTDFIIWTLRFLHFFSIFEIIGKTYEVIRRIIIKDMLFFVLVIMVIFLAFGVTIQSLRLELEKDVINTIKDIVNIAYWPMFGYTDNLKCLIEENCTEGIFPKYTMHAKNFSFMLLIMYMIILLVLVNLLIAMFNQTFTEVNEIAEYYWKFSRYKFVLSYVSAPVFPPPLNLLVYLYSIIQSIFQLCKEQQRTNKIKKNTIITRLEKKLAESAQRKLKETKEKA